ncbi:MULTISPECIES: hypothetical protein [unclassified Sulfitobacter]|uniref:hypothetical protein n=1 Tax=unclassified Sulfitobacter TaxID=196795 RepID=UPI0007C2E337|nr:MULTISPECIES: hypothetical protein [unclassified Sulfitobacter]KZY05228.1 hypothetical protein A3721_14955 [Sulfitobacter sp. HI0023]KZY25627.1 hypothetical protein A3728_18380 [Sulfitobacter sp. HI0040]KZZ66527.1 hypothetical protein A3764_16810 [Sulfitobacter sp. HI0129]
MGKQRFTQSELARAVRACKDAGMEIEAAVIDREGSIRVIAAKANSAHAEPVNPADLVDP